MSASRQKKLRQEQAASAADNQRKTVTEEEKAAKRLKVWTIVFYVVIGLMVLGILVAAILNTGVLERTITAVTVGEHKLTAAQMNYFYRDYVDNLVNSNSYMSMILGTEPLDETMYDDNQTWADYLMSQAVITAKNTYAVYDEAVAQGFTLPEETQSQLDMTLNNMSAYAKLYGYSNTSAMLRATYGRGCSESSYRNYLLVSQTASAYATEYAGSLDYTQEEIDAYGAEDPTAYNSYSYRYYLLKTSDYYPEGVTEPSEEEKAAALTAAEDAAKSLVASVKGDEEAFKAAVAELTAADEKTESESTDTTEPVEQTDDTLHENVLRSGLVAVLTDWVTADGRQAGDTTYVAADNEAGYYVAMFLSSTDNAGVGTVNVRHILISTSDSVTAEEAKAKVEELKTTYEENPTEEHFAELAEQNSADGGSSANGGLYENVAPGQMVDSFNDWIFDESRKPGDVGIVETTHGCHLMYFVGPGEYDYRDAMIVSAKTQADYEAWYNGLTEAMTTEEGLGLKLTNKSITLKSNSSN